MATVTSPRKLEVQLMVDHPHISSSELAKLLTLPPDEHWDVGQRYRPTPDSSEQRYQFSRWALRETASSLDELATAIRALTHRIYGIEPKFHSLPSDSTVSLTLFVTETDTVIGMGIDQKTIGLLARIKAGIEVSLVVEQQS